MKRITFVIGLVLLSGPGVRFHDRLGTADSLMRLIWLIVVACCLLPSIGLAETWWSTRSTEELLESIESGQMDADSAILELGRRRDPRIGPVVKKAAVRYEGKSRRFLREADPSGKSEQVPENVYEFRRREEPVEFAAKQVAARLGYKEHFDEIVAGLSSKDGKHRLRCIDALGDIGDRAAIAPLFRSGLLDDDGTPDEVDNHQAYRYSGQAIWALIALIGDASLRQTAMTSGNLSINRSALKQWWRKNKAKYEKLEYGKDRVREESKAD